MTKNGSRPPARPCGRAARRASRNCAVGCAYAALRGPARTALALQRSFSTPRSFLETITDAVKCFDHLEVVVDGFEFFAQALDVAVDRAVIDIDLIVIGGVHQRVAAFHHAGPRGERLEDEELGHGESHRIVLP